MILRYIFGIITILCSLVSCAQNRGHEKVLYVKEVKIKSKPLVDFIKERVFVIADYFIAPTCPFVRYEIIFEKTPWIKRYNNPYHVDIGAYGEWEDFTDVKYQRPYDKENPNCAYVTYIDGREICIVSTPDNPYLEVEDKKIRFDRKIGFSFNGGIVWNITMSDDKLLGINLALEITPDITQNKRIRKDAYLFPNACIMEIKPMRPTINYLIEISSKPPMQVTLPNIL